MTFAAPHVLWLLVLPVAWLVWEITLGRRAAVASSRPKILRAEIGTKELSLVRDSATRAPGRIRPWLTLGLTFAIVALARPQWGRIEEPVYDQSREILLAIDLSRSMLAPDVKPSRLDRAKLLIQSLLEKLKGERVGLIVFSGTAFLQSPLSSDYEILREFLPALGPDFLPEGGTNYRALIDTALDAFGTSGAADRFLIILSDGEATDDDWSAKVADLKTKGVRVIGLGIGTSKGTMIPDGSGGFVKDPRGAVVMSKLESSTLQSLANATAGTYRDASAWIDLASLVEETVNTGQKGTFTETNTVRYVDRFQWPLALALWCFLLSFYYEFPVKPRSRDIPLAREKEPAGKRATDATAHGSAVGFFIALLVAAVPQRTQAAVTVAPPPPPPINTPTGSPTESAAALGRIVNRLSQKDALNAVDVSELAHETLNWGRRLKDAGTTVPPGPVQDALAGLEQLEKQGNKLADWDQLRKDLEALLQRPPPPPPQQQQQQNDKQKDQPQKQDKSDQNKQDQSNKDQKQSPQEQKSEDQKQDQSAFGDMSKPTPPTPQPQKQPGETQKVGGAPEKKETPTDPAMAMPMEKLEQLKNQDSPSQLFQMMQADRSQASRKKPQKDW